MVVQAIQKGKFQISTVPVAAIFSLPNVLNIREGEKWLGIHSRKKCIL